MDLTREGGSPGAKEGLRASNKPTSNTHNDQQQGWTTASTEKATSVAHKLASGWQAATTDSHDARVRPGKRVVPMEGSAGNTQITYPSSSTRRPPISVESYDRAQVLAIGLACPFAKSDPITYTSLASCRPREGFRELRELNEHIWRKHTPFFRCGFCPDRWSISMARGKVSQKKEKHWESCEGKHHGTPYFEKFDEDGTELLDWQQQRRFEEIKSIRGNERKLKALYEACGKPVPDTFYVELNHPPQDPRNNSSYHSGESLPVYFNFSPPQTEPSSRSSVPHFKDAPSLENDGVEDVNLLPLVPDMDTATLYSEETIAPVTSAQFEAEMGHGLRNQLSKHSDGEVMLSTMTETLPIRLAGFARRLGTEGSPHCRDIMRFVHKHRNAIASRVNDSFVEEPGERRNKVEQGMTGEEKILKWLASLGDGPSEVLEPPDAFQGVEDEDDTDTSLHAELAEYTQIVTSSDAYGWLLSTLRCDLDFALPGEADARRQISTLVLNHLRPRRVSRSVLPPVFEVTYTVTWDVLGFIKTQEYPMEPVKALRRALTLTGSMDNAEGVACGDYICRTWPSTGAKFMEILEMHVTAHKSSRKKIMLDDGTILTVSSYGSKFQMRAMGCADTVAEIGEQLAWISSALRPFDSEQYSTTCYMPIASLRSTSMTVDRVTMEISLDFEHPTPSKVENGTCWGCLFRNPVVVDGYPIRRRPLPETGLELSLGIMADLVQCERVTFYGNRLFMKGFCTMLVAVQLVGDTLIWHAYTKEDGSYIHYHDHTETGDTADPNTLPQLKDIAVMRHVVGWCMKVQDNCGSVSADLRIRGSGLSEPEEFKLAFERINLGVSKYITANVSVALGLRDRPPQVRGRDPYIDQVRLAATKSVILFDTGHRRAWLLDGATALAHLLRASLVSDKKIGIDLDHSHEDLHVPDAENGPMRALKMLLDTRNMNLKLRMNLEEEELKFETKRPQAFQTGRPRMDREATGTTKQTWYRVRDRVNLIFSVLEELFNHQEDCRPAGVGMRIRTSPRQQLEGFDFIDLANGTGQIFPKAVKLEPNGRAWVDLARELRAITLFGRDFGELLQPITPLDDTAGALNCEFRTCPGWSSLPEGMDYLAMANSTLQRILDDKGDTKKIPWRIINRIFLYGSTEVFEPCSCVAHGACDRVLVPLPESFLQKLRRKPQGLSELPTHGAIVFGHSSKLPLNWNDTGDPVAGDSSAPEQTPLQISESSLTADSTSASSLQPVSAGSPSSAVTTISNDKSRSPSPWARLRDFRSALSRDRGE